MSWSFSFVGTPAAVKQAVAKVSYAPKAIMDLIASIPETFPPNSSYNGVSIETHGHLDDSGFGNISKFECKPITLQLDQPQPSAAPAPAAPPP